jgi:hypothetical protein
MEEVAEGLRRLQNEELRNLYASQNTIMVTKSRGLRLAGYMACMEEVRNVYRLLVTKPKGKI